MPKKLYTDTFEAQLLIVKKVIFIIADVGTL